MRNTNNFDHDTMGIRATISNYFEGVKEGDMNKIKSAFLPKNIHMKGIMKINGKEEFKFWENEELLNALYAASSDQIVGNIISINVYSKNAAFALFNFNNYATDAFQLLKIEGEWKIVNKVFVEQ